MPHASAKPARAILWPSSRPSIRRQKWPVEINVTPSQPKLSQSGKVDAVTSANITWKRVRPGLGRGRSFGGRDEATACTVRTA